MSNQKRILIVGGLSAGPSAAAKARRCDEDAEIIMFERGEDLSYAVCGMPYVIGGLAPGPDSLNVLTAGALAARFNIKIKTRSEALAVDTKAKKLKVRERSSEIEYPYDSLVLCTGAEPIRPPIPGIELENIFTLRWREDLTRVMKALESGDVRQAAVIGAGPIGLETAENLRELGLDVTVIEKLPQVMPQLDPEMAGLVREELEANGVRVLTSDAVVEFRGGNGKLSEVALESGETVKARIAFVNIGVRPNVKLAREAGIRIGETGAIAVNEFAETDAEGVFAAGDCAETLSLVTGKTVWIPLATVAQRQGRAAGANAAGRRIAFQGALGTFIVKVFELAAGRTGLSEREAMAAGYKVFRPFVIPEAIPVYYPQAGNIWLKLVVDMDTRLILGAQAAGPMGVDKRLDVAATAILGALTVDDLFELDLAYSPPFNTAKDPVNNAAMTASNVLDGEAAALDIETLKAMMDQGLEFKLLDVRPQSMFDAGYIPGSINIPLEELRKRIDDLDPNQPWIITCRQGQLAYFAARVLMQRGFNDVKFLTGSFESWRARGFPINR